jgi:hypothetical protein
MATIRGGVFTRADARACGYRDDEIDHLLASGGWRRIRRGTYAAARTLLAVDDEMMHLRRLYELLRQDRSLVASHQSAAALHALPLWGLDLSTVHVTTGDGRPGRHRGGVHRHLHPRDDEVELWNGFCLTSPARTVAEVAGSASRAAAVVVADAALYAGLVSRAGLADVVRALPGATRAAASAVLAAVSGLAGSVGESRLRLLLSDAGLPAPSAHAAPMEDPSTCGLWFPDQRTVVEYEPWLGFWRYSYDDFDECERFEDPAAVFARERAAAPIEHVWVPWPDLNRPDVVAERVRSAFARAESRSGVRVFDPDRRRTGRRRPPRNWPDAGDVPC